MQILLSNSQAGPGRTVKQEQEEISRNHVQAFIPGSVDDWATSRFSPANISSILGDKSKKNLGTGCTW